MHSENQTGKHPGRFKKKYNDEKQRELAQDLPNGWDVILEEFSPRAIQYKTHIVI
jgi:uncharacterized protein YbdZ (MbtH family)